MRELVWSDALSLEMPVMDQTHMEFVDLLAAVQKSDDAQLMAHWERLVEHTQEHFDREDAWMQQTRFAAGNCHAMQHNVVLQVMREVLKRGNAGDQAIVRQIADELVLWFPEHAQSMDAALAAYMCIPSAFDPVTGIVHRPEALPAEEIHGCGGSRVALRRNKRLALKWSRTERSLSSVVDRV